MTIFKRLSINRSIRRISKYEKIFDLLQAINLENPQALINYKRKLNSLIKYYENGKWLKDYALDEQNLLPKKLKRGILSEDGFYNFLTEINQIIN